MLRKFALSQVPKLMFAAVAIVPLLAIVEFVAIKVQMASVATDLPDREFPRCLGLMCKPDLAPLDIDVLLNPNSLQVVYQTYDGKFFTVAKEIPTKTRKAG